MRKLFYLGFVFVLAAGVGCAITDYGLITDNDQVKQGFMGTVNTTGKAHITEGIQVVTNWTDGNDELFSFVDQKSNGDQTLTTYNNYSTGSDPWWHDDFYCNPDWQGCAIVTADNPYVGDVDPFDYVWNQNCAGSRSLSLLVSSTRYYGECGRVKMSLTDRIQMLNMGRYGRALGTEGLFYDLNRSNLSITLNNNAGFATSLPITADTVLFMSPGTRKGQLDMTNPMLASMGRSYADFLANHATHSTTLTASYNGINLTWNIAGNTGISSPSRVLANMNAHF